MTEHLNWKKRYDLGVEDIDYQHHYFLNLVNRLARELPKSSGPEETARLLKELNMYAKFHFFSEENMMEKAEYPELQEHKQSHRHLIDMLGSKQVSVELNSSQENVDALIGFLVDWFLHHTMMVDKKYTVFLQQHPGHVSE